MTNLFDFINLPKKGEELFEEVFSNEHMKIEKILSNELNNGKWYNQDDDELVLLIRGNATIEYEDTKKDLIAGDFEYIKSKTKHRVLKTSDDALWLAIHIKEEMFTCTQTF